jgi:hypothetical protein
MLAGQSAKAETIAFHDLTDTVTVDGSSRVVPVAGSCTGELCTVTLNAPTGFVFRSTTLPLLYRIAESVGGTVSDRFLHSAFGVGSSSVQFTFSSDVEGAVAVPCTSAGGVGVCDAVENGLLQTAATITWCLPATPGGPCPANTSVDMTDDIAFQSDLLASEVPEPASLLLFGSGFALAGGFLRRRWRLVTTAV